MVISGYHFLYSRVLRYWLYYASCNLPVRLVCKIHQACVGVTVICYGYCIVINIMFVFITFMWLSYTPHVACHSVCMISS